MSKVGYAVLGFFIFDTINENCEYFIDRKYLSEITGLSKSGVSKYINELNIYFANRHENKKIVYYFRDGYKVKNVQKLSEEELKDIFFCEGLY